MEVLPLTIFLSLVLAASFCVFFWRWYRPGRVRRSPEQEALLIFRSSSSPEATETAPQTYLKQDEKKRNGNR